MRKSVILMLAIALLQAGGTVLAAATPAKTAPKAKVAVKATGKAAPELDNKKIVEVARDFISKYLIDGGKVDVVVKSKEGNVYNLGIKINGSNDEINSAISSNGKYFYPTVMDIEKVKKEKQNAPSATKPSAPVAKVETKSDKPVVELFVMSHCPYGTQIEKGILPVLETLGSKIDFRLKFVDYAMHGQKEIDEQLNQYCISQEQNDKLLPYLKCFLEAGDSASCVTTAKIDATKLKTCITSTDTKFKISESYKDKTQWSGSFPPFSIYKSDNDKYGVQGSPTLVINGKETSTGRDSASLLATICSAFNKAPNECKTVLSNTSPAPGFGFKAAANNSASAGCGQ